MLNGEDSILRILSCRFFLFLVGVSMVYSYRKRLVNATSDRSIWIHTIKRVVILWILGMMVQGNLLTYDINQIKLFYEYAAGNCCRLFNCHHHYSLPSCCISDCGNNWAPGTLLANSWADSDWRNNCKCIYPGWECGYNC